MTQSNSDKAPVSLSKPPMSGTGYKVMEGEVVEGVASVPMRSVSSGQIPAVLDARQAITVPALKAQSVLPTVPAVTVLGAAPRKGTLVGMSAVTPPATRLVVATEEQAPISAPASVQPIPLTQRAPYVRSRTQVGIVSPVIAKAIEAKREEAEWELVEQQASDEQLRIANERAASEAALREEEEAAARRRSALDSFLSKVEESLAKAGGFDFAHREKGLESMVTSAFAGLGRQHQRTLVIKSATVQAMMKECMPDFLATAATEAARAKLAEATDLKMAILFAGSGINLSDVPEDVRSRISDIAEAFGKSLPATLTAVVDAEMVTDAFKATLVYHSKAILDGKNVEKIAGFTLLWKQGWVPVGMLKDKSFLMIAK